MKKWMIYGLYLIVVTLIFLYYRFPTGAVTSYINYQISKSMPGVRLSVDSIRPGFPPGLRFNTMLLYDEDRAVISADRLKITPAYSTILSSEKFFYVAGDFCGGHLKGNARLSASAGNPGVDIALAFGDLQISRIQGLHEWIPPKLSGIATGSFVFSNSQPPYGKGSADLTVSDCSLEFNPPLWGINQLAFSSVDAKLELASRRVLLKRLEIKSDQLSGEASGSLRLTVPVNRSLLNISGRITPQPGFIKKLGDLFPLELFSGKKNRSRGIPFQISGTIEHPNFKLR